MKDLGHRFKDFVAKGTWLELVLLFAVLIQIWIVGGRYVVPWYKQSIDLLGKSAIERSAIIQYGIEFSDYVQFVSSLAPPEADVKIIIPHRQLRNQFTHIGYMQYFFYPRRIDNCNEPLDACVLNLTGEKTYILSVPGFPPFEVASSIKTYVPYNNRYGLFIPQSLR